MSLKQSCLCHFNLNFPDCKAGQRLRFLKMFLVNLVFLFHDWPIMSFVHFAMDYLPLIDLYDFLIYS